MSIVEDVLNIQEKEEKENKEVNKPEEVIEGEKEAVVDKESVTKEEIPDELTELKQANTALRAELEKIASHTADKADTEPKKEIGVEFNENFLAGVEDEFDKGALNKMLNRVASFAVKNAMLNSMRVLPEMVTQQIMSQRALAERRDKFYADYPLLAENKEYVRTITEKVLVEHPDWDIEKTLEEVGNRALTGMGISKKAKATVPTKTGTPSRKPSAKEDSESKTIKQLLGMED